ncbi:flippase-like domain-containing protein, partial [Candidatus Saccharibacteria bacterium]|nr:flippase-like domain-containing protein [Candidatus Saccharibacteria bacterium]
MKHKWLNVLIILAITVGFLWYVLKDNFNEVIEVLFRSNIGWLFLALLAFIIYMAFDTLSTYGIIKLYKPDATFKFALYLGVINKFFCGITPLSSGGQPMQIYELKKKGVPISTGANIEVQAYMMFQIALMFTAILSIIL